MRGRDSPNLGEVAEPTAWHRAATHQARQASAPPRVSPRSRSDPRHSCRTTQRKLGSGAGAPASQERSGLAPIHTIWGMRRHRVLDEMTKGGVVGFHWPPPRCPSRKDSPVVDRVRTDPEVDVASRGPATAAGQSEDVLTAIRRPGATRGRVMPRRSCAGFPDWGSGRGASWGSWWRRSSWSPRWAR